MDLSDITPIVLTYDEEANIGRSLAALDWAERIVVLDSGSTDRTEEICRNNPRVAWFQRPFDSHSEQWNAALGLAKTSWVLTLDADYIVTPQLLSELRFMESSPGVDGFRIPFVFYLHGKPIRASLLPPRIALFRVEQGRYVQDGHTQDLVLQGVCESLSAPLIHDDRKAFSRWWSAQKKYARLEADKLASASWQELPIQDRLRYCIVIAPVIIGPSVLLWKGAWLDGRAGLSYTWQRTLAEGALSAELLTRLWAPVRHLWARQTRPASSK